MTALTASDVSTLSRIASNPKLAGQDRAKTLRPLSVYAREVALALLGDRDVSEHAQKTAGVIRNWLKRQS